MNRMRLHYFFPRGCQAIASGFSVVLLAFIWLLFAPTQVGGLASYAIVAGSSMEPNFHLGDLVIARKEAQYQVGDAVVYRNPQLQGFVFHRIVAEQAEHLILQGDSNSWIDNYQPTQEEVLGKLWLHVPRGGRLMQKVRSPLVLASIAAVLGYFISIGLFNEKTKGKKRMKNTPIRERLASFNQKIRSWLAQINSPEHQGSSNISQGSILEGSFLVLGSIALLSMFLGIISFSRPVSRPKSIDLPYQHLGIYSYLAPAPQGIYDSNAITSGDPVFPALTCAIDVNMQYTFIAQGGQNISGTYQLTAVLREKISGWQREIPLQEETPFRGTTFGTTIKLDVCHVESLIDLMEEQTGLRAGAYTLSVIPNIHLTGTLQDNSLDTVFNGGFTFSYNNVHFYLPQGEQGNSPLSITESGGVTSKETEANTVVFLGYQFPIPAIRWITVLGLLGSLTGFVLLGLKLQRLSHVDQDQFFRLKYDSLIVDVQGDVFFTRADCIEVISMDALARLAERFSAVILHVKRNDSHEYFVQASGATYRFQLMDEVSGSVVAESDITTVR